MKSSQGSGQGTPPVRLRPAGAEDWYPPPPPPPLYHHPVVAISLILTVSAIVQVGVWIATQRLSSSAVPPPSAALTHGYLFERVLSHVAQRHAPAVFPAMLFVSLLSGIGWFSVARLAIGRPWGLWTGLIWGMHPGFAFLASRASGLNVVLVLTPVLLWTLAWWRYRRHRTIAALLAGICLGLLCLVSTVGLLLLPVVEVTFLLSRMRRKKRIVAAIVCLAGFGLVMLPALRFSLAGERRSKLLGSINAGVPLVAEPDGDMPPAAMSPSTAPAGVQPTSQRIPSKTGDAFSLRRLAWIPTRMVRTVYATADSRFERPLLALQLMWIIPAIWGALVAIRFKPWRWLLRVATGFTATFWISAAIAEPLARNLTPIGGFGIIFGLIGWADFHERLFGRRLTHRPIEFGARPAARRAWSK